MGGICPSAWFLTRAPLEPHELQSPGAYTPSRWDGTGRPTATTEKSGFCIRGDLRYKLIAAAKEFFDFPFQVWKRTVGQRPAWIDDDIPRCNQFREPDAHNFADPSLEAIAENGLTHGSRCRKANARAGAASGQAESREQRSAVTEAEVVNFAVFAGS
jgi:hypothetical protein